MSNAERERGGDTKHRPNFFIFFQEAAIQPSRMRLFGNDSDIDDDDDDNDDDDDDDDDAKHGPNFLF